MNKNPAYLLAFIALVIIAIIGYRYNQYIVHKNFYIDVNTQCDPSVESCFAWDCDPEEDEECDNTPYKKVSILSSDAPKCLEEHSCENFTCDSNVELCEIVYCSESVLDEGEICATADEEIPEEQLEEEIIENQ